MRIVDAVFVCRLREEKELEYHQRLHQHEALAEVHCFLSGSGTFREGRSRYAINPGSVFLTFGGVSHQITAIRASELSYYAFLVELEGDEEGELRAEGAYPYTLREDMRFAFEEIRENGLSSDKKLKKSAALRLSSLLYQLEAGPAGPRTEGNSLHVKKALRFMEAERERTLTLSEISDQVGLNPSYFSRLFKAETGKSPLEYFNNLRMEEARSLLATTSLSVREIALRLGFCSEFHFSRMFKASSGFSPSLYRRNYLQIV
jgi:Transcriptional regulator containing an amidase domain and an AraC-type DNA-binding HTH domain